MRKSLRSLRLLLLISLLTILLGVTILGRYLPSQTAHAASPVPWQFKGASMTTYSQNDLGSADTYTALKQLAATGANVVTFVVNWYQDTQYSADIYQTGNTASDASLITAIHEAQSLGLKVAIKPHVDPLDGAWRAYINPCSAATSPCPAGNDLTAQWFSSYTTMMNHYADLAQQYGAVYLCIGAEFITLSTNPADLGYWTTLISSLRSHYHGPLTYSANWGSGSFATEYPRVTFWNQLDYLGISAYFELANNTSPTVSEMVSSWQNTWMPQIHSFQQQYGKQVLFTEGGFRSANQTAMHPWDSGDAWPLDLQQQANAYEATFEAWANVPWFAGTAFWYWNTNPNISTSDTDYPVQNKPAYTTITTWFGGSSGSGPTATPTTTTSSATPIPTASATKTPTPIVGGGPAPCPSGWTCTDIGSPPIAGSQTRQNGIWTINSSGYDIWGNSDQLRFISQPLAGDGSLSARVVSQSPTDPWAKAGLMLRGSTAADAPYYAVYLTPGNGIVVQARTGQGAGAINLPSMSGGAPIYLKVGHVGTSYTAYTSYDGASWTAIPGSTLTIDMSPILSGFAVASHAWTTIGTAIFDQVNATTGGTGPTATPTHTPTPTPTDTVGSGATATPTPRPTATFTPVPSVNGCPLGWSCGDVGSPSIAGSQSLSGGTWTVSGSGGDIWNTYDQFHYVWQTLTGDGAIMAPLRSQTNTDAWAKAGLMLRGSTDPGAPFYAVFVTPSNGINVQYRGGQGQGAQQLTSTGGGTPIFLEITRQGSTLTAFTSSNGTSWTAIPGSSITLSLPSPLLAGIAVTAHNGGLLSAITTDSVAVQTM